MDDKPKRVRMGGEKKRDEPLRDFQTGEPLPRHVPGEILPHGMSPEEVERRGVNQRDPYEIEKEPDAPTRFDEMMARYKFGKPFRD